MRESNERIINLSMADFKKLKKNVTYCIKLDFKSGRTFLNLVIFSVSLMKRSSIVEYINRQYGILTWYLHQVGVMSLL